MPSDARPTRTGPSERADIAASPPDGGVASETRSLRQLLDSEARLNDAQRIARLGSWELDLVNNVLTWSDEIYRLFEVDKTRFGASYEAFLAAIHPEDRDLVNAAYMTSVAAKQPYDVQHRLLMPNGSIKWVHERGETSYDASGKPLRSVGTVHDVTERVLAERLLAASDAENRRALLEKEVLLREVHHRVKNNLQVISSLLHFHLKKTQAPQERSVLEDVRKRLFAMMLVHDKLFRANDLVSIPLGDYARSLLSTLAQSFEGRGRVELVVEAVDVLLPIELALPAGMVLCELVTNVFKHAFPGGRSGRVTLRVEREDDRVMMCVDDNGVGFPHAVDPMQTDSFGLHLVRSLVRQLDGTLEIKTDIGSHVCIRFPTPNCPSSRF